MATAPRAGFSAERRLEDLRDRSLGDCESVALGVEHDTHINRELSD